MAKRPSSSSPSSTSSFGKPDKARADDRTARDDAAPQGFGETPQAAFEGAPLTGPVSDWARQLTEDDTAPSEKSKERPVAKQAKPARSARGRVDAGSRSPHRTR